MTSWPNEYKLESSVQFRYSQKCLCNFARSISYFVAPFEFQAFSVVSDKSRLVHVNAPLTNQAAPLGSSRLIEGLMKPPPSDGSDPSVEDEGVCLEGGPSSPRNPQRLPEFGLPVKRRRRNRTRQSIRRMLKRVQSESPSSHASDDWRKNITEERTSNTSGPRNLNGGPRNLDGGPDADDCHDPTTQQKEYYLFKHQGGNPSPIPCSAQYVRSVNEFLWIRSKTCSTNENCHLPIVLFFGGKDMLALAWLRLLGEWIGSEIKSKVKRSDHRSAKRRGNRREKKKDTTGDVPTQSEAAAGDTPGTKVPRLLPQWDSSVLLRKTHASSRSRGGHISTGTQSPRSPDTEIHNTTTNGLGTEPPPPAESSSTQCPRPSTVAQLSNVTLKINAAFGLVEFPGYGYSEGLPTPSSCVDSGMEVLRSIISEINPRSVEVHLIGYSLGCAIALRVANLVADQIVENYRLQNAPVRHYYKRRTSVPQQQNNNNNNNSASKSSPRSPSYMCQSSETDEKPLDKLVALKTLLLVAPFSSTWETANALLHVPPVFQRVSKFVFNTVSDSTIQYDNKDAISRLCKIIKMNWGWFPDFSITVMFGDQDRLIPPSMGLSLASTAKEVLGSKLLNKGQVKLNCVRVIGADHVTIVQPRLVVKVLRHCCVDTLCSIHHK